MTSSTPSWFSAVARAGYLAKGVVYLVIGYLALQFAIGFGGKLEGSSGALKMVKELPGGSFLILIVAVGLAAYSIYRLLGAFVDAENEGDDGKGLAKRAGYIGSGVAYGALTVAAATGLSSSGGGSEEKWTGKVLAIPGGAWLVGILGVAIILAGVFQWVKALKEKYKENFALDDYAATQRHWINRIAKAGLIARGIVFPIIGFFLIQAALQGDSSEAKGLGDALKTLAQQSYGAWILGITAAGLFCYGIYCWVLTRYGRFGTA